MRCSEDLWLFDLGPCKRFWCAQAKELKQNPVDLIQHLLEQQVSEYKAVLAHHPWQALYMLNDLNEHNQQQSTLINLDGLYGKNLYEQASWSSWFKTIIELKGFLAQLKIKSMPTTKLSNQIEHMKRSIQRLGLERPYHLNQAHSCSIKRRFGTTIAKAWTWTFPQVSQAKDSSQLFHEERSDLFQDEFPWISWQAKTELSVSHHLDQAITTWDHCAIELQKDLDRLAHLRTNNQHSLVTELKWTIHLQGDDSITIPIYFRNPHALSKEIGHHDTALYQMQFAYDRAMTDFQNRKRQLQYPDEVPNFVSWSLCITKELKLPQKFVSLFEQEDKQEQTLSKLLALENKVDASIDRYQLCQDFYPSDAYSKQDKKEDHESNKKDFTLWSVAAIERPLFIYKKPYLFESGGFSCCRKFLERTTIKWWQDQKKQQELARDYYLLIDHEQKAHWVFHNKLGQWYTHGIYS